MAENKSLHKANVYKDETVSMEPLARIAAVMECGLNNIVEISAEIEI